MILRNGKFYDSAGNMAPLEFGNKEQVQILRRVDNLRSEGEDLDVEYDISKDGSRLTERYYPWYCVCGERLTLPFMGRYRTPAGRKVKCTCGLKYEGFDGDWGFAVKLIS